jgi:hypothetical protein
MTSHTPNSGVAIDGAAVAPPFGEQGIGAVRRIAEGGCRKLRCVQARRAAIVEYTKGAGTGHSTTCGSSILPGRR